MPLCRLNVMDHLLNLLEDDSYGGDYYYDDWNIIPVKRCRLTTTNPSGASPPRIPVGCLYLNSTPSTPLRHKKPSSPIVSKNADATPLIKRVKPMLATTIVSAEPTENAATAPDNFNLQFELRDFAPSEIAVKLSENGKTVEVRAKHEHGSKDGTHYECREFFRQCTIPDNVLVDQLRCKLNEDGLLRLEAPTRQLVPEEAAKVRVIPIEYNQNKPKQPKADTTKVVEKEKQQQQQQQAKEDDAVSTTKSVQNESKDVANDNDEVMIEDVIE